MSSQKFDLGWLSRGGLEPLNQVRNGVQVAGHAMGHAGDFLNFLLGARRKALFSRSIRPSEALNAVGTSTTWRFAFLTGRGESSSGNATVRFVVVCVATGAAVNPATVSVDTLLSLTGGLGGETNHVLAQMAFSDAAGTVPDNYHVFVKNVQLARATPHRASIKVANHMRPISISAWELVSQQVNPDSGTLVNAGGMAYRLPITADLLTDFHVSTKSLWENNQTPMITWCVPSTTPVQRVSATAANIFDQTQTAYSSTSAGFFVYPQNRHSLDSTSVGVQFYCYASSTGTVKFLNSGGGTVASIAVSGASTLWYTATGVLNGHSTEDKIDIHLAGDGAASCSLYAAGAFFYSGSALS